MFYKDGQKEEMLCQGAVIVERLLQVKELDTSKVSRLPKTSRLWNQYKENYGSSICHQCLFQAEDCDFQSDEISEDIEPCGGFILLVLLIENNLITESDLKETT